MLNALTMKKLFILGVLGLILGNLIATWAGPVFLNWWFEPPVAMAFNCTDPIRWAMQRLITIQLSGSITGMVLGVLVAILFFMKKKKPEAI